MVGWSELHALKESLASAITGGITALIGLVVPASSAARFSETIRLPELVSSSLLACAYLVFLFVVICAAESLTAARRSPYASRVFLQDVLYVMFYKGGFFDLLIWAAIANALAPRLGFLKIEVLAALPPVAAYAVYWLSVDFLNYWWHRLMHEWEPLWAFHSVHHTQEEMSFATGYRLHPLESFFQYLVFFIPLLVLGIPSYSWVPLLTAQSVFLAIQHSSLNWGFGPAYYLFVSPRFHALHHSTDARHYKGNYAKFLSLWDFLFRTGVYSEHLPARLGVDGLPVPRTLAAQLMAPFRILSHRRLTGRPVAAPIMGGRQAAAAETPGPS